MRQILDAEELLLGSRATYEVEIPRTVLRPADDEDSSNNDDSNDDPGCVRIRPLDVATLSLISVAAQEEPGLVPLLMIKEALVEPVLPLDRIRRMPVGLVHFLVGRINTLSGLDANGEAVSQALPAPITRAHVQLARHYGWTPRQVAELTPGQIAVYLAAIEEKGAS